MNWGGPGPAIESAISGRPKAGPLHRLVGQRSCAFLPGLDVTGNDPKDRVRPGALHTFETSVGLRIARRELRHEMKPLVLELPSGHSDRTSATRRADLACCERVATMDGLRVDAAKVVRDRAERRRLSAESLQLRVTLVTVRASPEHRLRQERFSPQRHEPASVEVLRMHGPETHVSLAFVSRWPDQSRREAPVLGGRPVAARAIP